MIRRAYTCPSCGHQFSVPSPHMPCESFAPAPCEPPTSTPEEREVAAGWAEARAMIEAGLNP